MDSRVMSILLNLDLKVDSTTVAREYATKIQMICEAQKGTEKKVYKNLTQTFKECYLTGSLKYGKNFVM